MIKNAEQKRGRKPKEQTEVEKLRCEVDLLIDQCKQITSSFKEHLQQNGSVIAGDGLVETRTRQGLVISTIPREIEENVVGEKLERLPLTQTVFRAGRKFKPGTLKVFVNGLRLMYGRDNDYILHEDQLILFNASVYQGYNIQIDYTVK